jgi:site-specific DNA-methyltransferase (adenine-specific)
MTSNREDWCTPAGLLDLVRDVAPIALDPCSNPHSIVGAKVEWRLDRDGDSLVKPWADHGGMVYVNPPYGRKTGLWVQKCAAVAAAGGNVIALLPARTDTRWFHAWCVPRVSDAVVFLRGRLTFLGAPGPAPFPSMIVHWGNRKTMVQRAFAGAGKVWL